MIAKLLSSRFGKNVIYGAIGFGFPTIVVFLSYPVLIHKLGAAGFGIVQLGQAIGNGATFIDLGMTNATVFFVAQRGKTKLKSGTIDVVVTSTLVMISAALVIAAVVFLSASSLPILFRVPLELENQSVRVFQLAALQIIFVPAISVGTAYYKGMHRFLLASGIVCLMSVSTWGVCAMLALIAPLNLVVAAFIFASGTFLTLCVVVMLAAWKWRSNGGSIGSVMPRVETFREMWAYSAAIFGQGVAAMLNNQLQRVLVGMALGPAAVTLYATSMQLTTKLHSAVGTTFEAFFPLVASATDRAHIISLYRRVQGLSIAIGAVALIPLAIFANVVCRIWLGGPLAEDVAPLVRVLCLATLFSIATIPSVMLINGLHRPWISFGFTLVTIFVTGLYLLVNIYHLKVETFIYAYTVAVLITAIGFVSVPEYLLIRADSFGKRPKNVDYESSSLSKKA